MNVNGEDLGELGGLGDVLPAELLKKLNEVLERLHQADHHHGGNIINIYAAGSQHVDRVERQYITTSPSTSLTPDPSPKGEGSCKEGTAVPEVLGTEAAMVLWQKAQEAGYVDDGYQPAISRTQSAILADEMAMRLNIKDKWKAFEALWNRRNMYRDYHDALDQRQSLQFRDTLKALFQ